MLIFRRSDCIFTVSGIGTVRERPYSAPIESGLSIGVLYGSLQGVTIPETVNVQFDLLKMSMVML